MTMPILQNRYYTLSVAGTMGRNSVVAMLGNHMVIGRLKNNTITFRITDFTAEDTIVLICPEGGSITHAQLERGNKATDWTPAPEDAQEYTEDKVAEAKKYVDDLEVGGRNLIVQSTITRGKFLTVTGSESINAGWFYTDFIPVSNYKNLVTSGYSILGDSPSVVYYNSSKVFVKGINNGNLERAKNITIDSGIAFIRFSGMLVDLPTLKLEKGNKATDWTPAPEDVDASIAAVKSDLTVEAGKITALNTKTNGHTTQIGTLETSYNGLNSTVTALETGKVGTVAFSALEQNLNGFKTTVANTYADKTTVTQLSTQWQTTTTLANGHTSQIASLGTDINLRATKAELISQINLSPETILIASKKIQIKGDTYIDNGVIKTAHIADLAVSGAKIANASIASAKIINLDASKIVANDLSAITTNTGQLNVTGWLDFTTENRGLRGSYDFGDPYGEAYNYRWFTGDFRLSHRHLYMYGNVYNVNSNNTKGAHDGYFETLYGSDYTKHRRWNYNGGTMLGRVDITSTYISMSDTYTTENIRLNSQNGDSYFRGTLDISKDITMRSGYSLFAYNIQSLDVGSNIYFNYSRKDLGDFRIGKDNSSVNGGRLIQSLAIYNRTYSGTANVTVTTDGTLGRVTSARKYKYDIKTANSIIENAKSILRIQPKSWIDKSDMVDGVINPPRWYGFIADEFDALGLKEVVVYANNEVDGLNYDKLTTYHNVILREHEDRINTCTKIVNTINEDVVSLVAASSAYGLRLNTLETEVFRLKKRVEELEKVA